MTQEVANDWGLHDRGVIQNGKAADLVLFDIDEVELDFRTEALLEIAKKALQRKTGARGLRSIMEELLVDTMFELPNIDLEKVIVDENSVLHSTDPIKVYKSPKKKSSSAG